MEEKSDAGLRSRFSSLVHEARGLLSLLKSVKGRLGQKMRDDQLYRMTLRRFRETGIRLATYADAFALVFGDEKRDDLLRENGCTWDGAKSRVDLG